jgi:hypothetical protein
MSTNQITQLPPDLKGLGSKIESLAKWLVALAGICYATGFLVIYTFFGHFQMRDLPSDFLKLKYVYVGILCWLFPAGFFLPLGALRELYKTMKTEKVAPRKGLEALISGFLSLFVPVVVYFMVEFARPSKTLPPGWIAASMAFAFPGFYLFDLIKTDWLRKTLRYGTATVISASFFILGKDFIRYVFEIVVFKHGYIYIVFVASALSIFPRNRRWLQERGLSGKTAQLTWVIATTLSVLLMYLAVLSYAAWVYPYVPATRGGGDYSVLSDVTIRLHEKGSTGQCWGNVRSANLECSIETERFKVIDETSDSFFVANIHSGSGPTAWSEWPFNEVELKKLPVVIEIPKADVSAIVYCRTEDPVPCNLK